jgi:hypothetical protein
LLALGWFALGLAEAAELSAGRKPLVSAVTSLVLDSGEHPMGIPTREQSKRCFAKIDFFDTMDFAKMRFITFL